ncbi:MAG: hypothetical protein EB824_06410 [Thaumarchaeota archaeon S15]|nr:MAG: hypothetical protein EB824_06410 [Thaumarchaeota archaeon S15]RNJ72834.1 MAG: hypothetical protein EB833_04190 [Thaumarchaeota archaeon S13]
MARRPGRGPGQRPRGSWRWPPRRARLCGGCPRASRGQRGSRRQTPRPIRQARCGPTLRQTGRSR